MYVTLEANKTRANYMKFLNELIDMVTSEAGGVGPYLLACLIVAVILFILVIVSREFLCWFLKIPSVIERLSDLERKLAETSSEVRELKKAVAQNNNTTVKNPENMDKEDWDF